MKKKSILLALATIILASCGDDNNEPANNNDRVRATFSADIGISRASASTWDQGDAIGIYMLDAGTANVTESAANRKYLTPEADGNFSPADASQTIYFPVDETRKVDFIAYYPHSASISGNLYKADITSQDNPAAIDLMTAAATSTADHPLDKDHTAIALTFAHRLSRVEVNLTTGEGITGADLAGIIITMSGQPIKADFDLLSGKLTPAADTGILTLNTAADGITASAIIIPQGELTGRTITFTMKNGLIFTWDAETDRTFEAGKKTILNIRLTRTGIEVTSSIKLWDTQGVVDDDADIQQ